MAEAPHDDVVGRPRTDALEREQLPMGDGGIAADVEFEVAVGDGTSQPANRVAPSSRHRERVVGRHCEFVGSGKDVCDVVDGLAERATDVLDDPTGHRTCAGDGDLLADHGANRRLVRIDAGGRSSAGHRRDEQGERGVRSERGVDGRRVAVEIEQATDALDGDAEVAPRRELDAGQRRGRRARRVR